MSQANGPVPETVIQVSARRDRPAETRHFLVLSEPDGSKRWMIVGQVPLTVGRSAPADIVVAAEIVSRLHCRIELINDDLHVTDLGSTNGTFVDGARITAPTRLRSGTQFQVGNQAIGYERRLRSEFEELENLERDLQSASRYVQMLLPQPVLEGPVRADWHFLPCARVGGDAFGYGPIDAGRWGGYILDVTGHGAAAALHAVTVLNVLRRRALVGIDMGDPSAVLGALNEMFQADSAEVPLFSIWSFTYDPASRKLRFCSAGHHPAFLVSPPDGKPQPINTANPLIGLMPTRSFTSQEIALPPNATLYLFSDGAFEVTTAEDKQLVLDDFLPLLVRSPEAKEREPQRIYRAVRALAKPGPLADDFSIVVFDFP